MFSPKDLGGEQLDAATFVRVVEALAIGDASTAWAAMATSSTGILAGYLPDAAVQQVWGVDPRAVIAGAYAPSGVARRVDGGLRVTGRWGYASGCHNAQWLSGGVLILDDDGKPESPLPLATVFPRDQATIVDTWDVIGLCGSGSDDFAVDDLFVPDAFTASIVVGHPTQAGTLYALPPIGLLGIGVAAVAVGIAQSSIDDVIAWAESEGRTTQTVLQVEIGRAQGALMSARATLHHGVDAAWGAAEAKGRLNQGERGGWRLATVEATGAAVRAVDAVYNVAGGFSLRKANPLQRHFRDAHTLTQHLLVSPRIYAMVGKVMMGHGDQVREL